MSLTGNDSAAGLRDILNKAASVFGRHDSPIGRELSTALAAVKVPATCMPESPANQPQGLDELLDRASPGSIHACRDLIRWRKPGFGRLPEDVSDRIDVAELVGPDGLLRQDGIRFGLLMQRPHHAYPSHRHAAEELYFVLAGHAFWSVERGEPHEGGAGTFVHHQSWQTHATTTKSEPMLAFWGWVGEIGSSSYRPDPPAQGPL